MQKGVQTPAPFSDFQPMSSIENTPEKHILYETPYLLIGHFPAYRTLFYKLNGYLEEEEAKDFFEKTLYFTARTNSSSLLADLSNFKGGQQSLASYVNLVFSQKLSEAGIERVGVNTPRSGFGNYTNKIAAGREAQSFLQVRMYTELEDALQWIVAESR